MREFIMVIRDEFGEELTRVVDAGMIPPVGSTVVNSDGVFILTEVSVDFTCDEITVYTATGKYDLKPGISSPWA
jgi:hypothetical protein